MIQTIFMVFTVAWISFLAATTTAYATDSKQELDDKYKLVLPKKPGKSTDKPMEAPAKKILNEKQLKEELERFYQTYEDPCDWPKKIRPPHCDRTI